MRTTAGAAVDFSPGCCADHVCGGRGPGGHFWAGAAAGRTAGAGLRRDADAAAEYATALAGLRAGPAVLAGGHRGAVCPYPPAGRRAGAHLPYAGLPAGGRAVFRHAQPPGAARPAVGSGGGAEAVAVFYRTRAAGGPGRKKSFKKAKKRLSKLVGMV